TIRRRCPGRGPRSRRWRARAAAAGARTCAPVSSAPPCQTRSPRTRWTCSADSPAGRWCERCGCGSRGLLRGCRRLLGRVQQARGGVDPPAADLLVEAGDTAVGEEAEAFGAVVLHQGGEGGGGEHQPVQGTCVQGHETVGGVVVHAGGCFLRGETEIGRAGRGRGRSSPAPDRGGGRGEEAGPRGRNGYGRRQAPERTRGPASAARRGSPVRHRAAGG